MNTVKQLLSVLRADLIKAKAKLKRMEGKERTYQNNYNYPERKELENKIKWLENDIVFYTKK